MVRLEKKEDVSYLQSKVSVILNLNLGKQCDGSHLAVHSSLKKKHIQLAISLLLRSKLIVKMLNEAVEAAYMQ